MTTKTGSGQLLCVRPLEFIGGIEDQPLVVFLYANIHVSLAVEESEAYFHCLFIAQAPLNLCPLASVPPPAKSESVTSPKTASASMF